MPRPTKENLSQLVKRTIKQKKLKLRDIEHKAGGGITRSYISRISSGEVTNLTLDTLLALSRGLELDPHQLLTAYYGFGPLPVENEATGETELGAVEFIELMQQVAVNPDLIQILRQATKLWSDEYPIVLKYLSYLNEQKQNSGKGKKPARKRAKR